MDSSGLTLYWTIFVKTMTRLQLNSGIFDWILVPLLIVFDGIAGLREDFVCHVDSKNAEFRVQSKENAFILPKGVRDWTVLKGCSCLEFI